MSRAAESRNPPFDDALRQSFRRVERATGYRRWVLDTIGPWLGQRVLELGCGVGNLTVDLLDRERLVAVDVVTAYLDEARRRLGARPQLRLLNLDICDGAQLQQALAEEKLDSALLLNVLEHLDDDRSPLSHLCSVLQPGSPVVVQVPAHPWLFGASDQALGHRRRYRPAQLRELLEGTGCQVEKMWQMNTLGVVGWLVSGRLLRQTMFSERQLQLYEALLPWQRALEPVSGVPLGLSLWAVGRTAH